ncbi:MAG: flavodoxin domain-containing protein [Clostridia bacterium]|nr:flavodoxin domain-containing protein [Clostridia bacterium]
MKIAIIYATKGGTTRECAELLAEELKNFEVDVLEMDSAHGRLAEYDTVVVGFPIRMGRAMKKARRFLDGHIEELKGQRTAYYVCCGFVDCFEDYVEKCIPECLRERAVDVACLGGSLDPKRVKGFDRLVIKAVRAEILGGGENGDQRKDMSLPTVMPENISQLAEKIKNV